MTPKSDTITAVHPTASRFDVRDDEGGVVDCYLRGHDVIRHPLLNKGTAFPREERIALEIDGLLPDRVSSLPEQVARAYAGYRAQPDPLSKHSFLRTIQERQEILYFAILAQHLEEMLPVIYTPTVGEAVKRAGLLYEATRGLSFSPSTIGRAVEIVAQHPYSDVRLIVATDSSAILGIGDQGAGGTEIVIGKLAIYTSAGGVAPYYTLPVTLDVGTDRSELRVDPLYVGATQERLTGDAYLDFMDRYVDATWGRWPDAIIQWEDLSRDAAFAVLRRYRDRGPTFNDDIQGTGAVVLAGVLAHCARHAAPITEQRFVIHGAGAGGLGVAWALRAGLERAGLSTAEALARVAVIDSRGLLVEGFGIDGIKAEFAQSRDEVPWMGTDRPGLLETVRALSPTVLIGLSGTTGAFGRDVIEAVMAACPNPLIMPLSNPTSLAEAQPVEVIEWTDGRATVATGSPFPSVEYRGRTIPVGQGNNAFIFPGLGHGAVIARASRVVDSMVLAAAEALARFTTGRPEWSDRIYPPISALPEAARVVAEAVVREAIACGVARREITDVSAAVDADFWTPSYAPLRAAVPPPPRPRDPVDPA